MYSSVDVIWTLLGAAMVFFMQAGFALCEAGMTRAKNTGNILMKNLMDFCIGTPCYWLVGFGIMFGGTGALIGGFDPFIRGTYDFGTLPTMCYVISRQCSVQPQQPSYPVPWQSVPISKHTAHTVH